MSGGAATAAAAGAAAGVEPGSVVWLDVSRRYPWWPAKASELTALVWVGRFVGGCSLVSHASP